MNRTDQAPEPTMEEILASIRLIISDDAKKGPSGRDDHPIRSALPRPETPPLNSLPEEEVLDLTEALVSPEEQSLAGNSASKSERHDIFHEKKSGLSQRRVTAQCYCGV